MKRGSSRAQGGFRQVSGVSRRIVLHIGMERTGTSAVQRFLARNRAALRLMGVRYPRPRSGPPEKHQDLVRAIAAEAAGTGADAAELIAAYTEGVRAPITVLSAEGLSAPNPAFARALAPLADRFDVRVVVYLRRQDEWALSAYRQAVLDPRVAEKRPVSEWLEDPGTRARLDYSSMLTGWEKAFGAENIRMLRYPHDLPLLSGFLTAADLPAAARLLPHRSLRVNESEGDPGLLEALSRNGAAGELPDLSQDARDALLESLRDGNNQIRERYLPENHTLFGVA